MKNSLSKTLLMILCIALVVMAGTWIPVKQLEIKNNDLPGWIPQDYMRIYKGTELYDYMDGAAPQYLDKGVQTTGAQWLDGQNNTLVQSMIMDFGRDSNAVAMFLEKKTQNVGQTVFDPQYPDSEAFMTLVLGGVQAYGHYTNFYFEIAAVGFSETTQAIATFDTMLAWYIQKIQSLRNVAAKERLTGSNGQPAQYGGLKALFFTNKQARQGNLLNGRFVRAGRKIAALPVVARIRSPDKK
jgi:hypothetical protein